MDLISIPQGAWEEDSPVGLELLLERHRPPSSCLLGIRYDNRLDYMHLDLEARLVRDGRCFMIDTLRLSLAEEPGVRASRGQTVLEHSLPLGHKLEVPVTGLYRLEVRPIEPSPLVGVMALGIELSQ